MTKTAVHQAHTFAHDGRWSEALELLKEADEERLGAQDLELKADCEWWLSRLDDSMATRQRAYSAYVAAGNDPRAGYTAWFLAYDHFSKGDAAAGGGWLGRARRHVEISPCVEQGYLAIADSHEASAAGAHGDAQRHAEEGVEIARRFGDVSLEAVALQTAGQALISQGRIAEGLKLLDEVMAAVVAGDVNAFCTGWVFCSVLVACLELGELGRAAEWSDAARAWCDSLNPGTPYHGLCRVYRVGVLALRGGWSEAEEEARRAADELRAFVPSAASAAWYEIGEIRRRLGDLEGAEDAFMRAHELGADPQPGLALVRRAQGRLDAARAGLRLSLAEGGGNRLRRSRLLLAEVEVALEAQDLEAAAAATAELTSIATEFDAPALRAMAHHAAGALQLARGEAVEALGNLRAAWNRWQELRLPYEAAESRALLGLAAAAAGDEERARLELRHAHKAFEELGATRDARRTSELLGESKARAGGLSARELEVLRLVAAGKTNREIGAELFISVHTVARHLSNIFTKLDLPSRSAAVAYAFEKGLASPSTG